MNILGKLLIHIGPSKTGTTSIQRFFSTHKKKLIDSHNFYYFGILRYDNAVLDKKAREKDELHKYLFQKPKEKILNNYFSHLENKLKSYEYVFISEEGLSLFQPELHRTYNDVLDIIKDKFNKYKPDYIFTLRNPKHALPSLFQELNKYNLSINKALTSKEKYLLNDFNEFQKSNYSMPFRPLKLKLEENLSRKIRYIKFMDLINSKLCLSHFTGDIKHDNIVINVQITNKGNTVNGKRNVVQKNFFLNFYRKLQSLKPNWLGNLKIKSLLPKKWFEVKFIPMELKVQNQIIEDYKSFEKTK